LLAISSPAPFRATFAPVFAHFLFSVFHFPGVSMADIFEKLKQIETRYDEMTHDLSSADVLADSSRYQKLAKQHAELTDIVSKYREWKEIAKGLDGAKQLLRETDDPEMKQMAHDEERTLETRRESVERELKILLLPKDPNDEKNVILEIRAGTGGD